ncbi:hypothetical protein CVT26_015526 [Gymnopilus dilepis]|uniref:7TM GPCR serpentine receptor class x (Srx) domain-containing protein n=1 Tax=Gymnopilus dilepis TaxID=231916 RepID=A0A409YD29_9AGAR|nr:hypothetical protein CVT26_015526 [Gymnopilus dilepis]
MSTLPTERTIWVGNNFATIAYGVDIYMVFHSWYLLKGLNTQTRRMRVIYIAFSVIQLFLFTLLIATNGVTEQFMWIDHRDFPGGPLAFFQAVGSSWYQVLNVACGVISLAMSDALLLYRCYIIWNANWQIMAFPLLIFASEVVTGFFFIVETAHPEAPFYLAQSTNFSVPWISIASGLNTLLTALIVGRILYVSRQNNTLSYYTGVIAILVESAIPLALSGIAFVICMALNLIENLALASIMGALNILCPQAIIIRVANGRAWSENTMHELATSMEFAERKTVSGHTGELSESSTTVV